MLRPTWVSIPGSAFRFAYGAFTLFDRLSQHRSATESVCNSPIPLRQVPDRPLNTHCATPAGLTRKGFRLYPFRSPLLRASLRFLLLRLLRCFTSPGDRLVRGDWAQHPAGFPHSEICGSMVACTSPQLIAACHVLLRPQAPRHSPCALSTLTPITSSLLLTSARFRLSRSSWSNLAFLPAGKKMVEMIGFEPTTSCLQSRRSPSELHPHSNHGTLMVGRSGFEPLTSRLSAACSNQLSYRPTQYSARKCKSNAAVPLLRGTP